MMFALLVLSLASPAQCPVEHARYVLRNHPKWTAYFRPIDSTPDWPSGLALTVDNNNSNHTSYWLPWNGGTDGLLNFASAPDITVEGWHTPNPDVRPRPEGDRQYLGFDADYNLLTRVPKRGDPAPSHMLFTDSADRGDETFGWKDFFDLTSCTADEHQISNLHDAP